MGAEYFSAYQDGTDVEQAFNDAVEHAEYEDGHGGYTGTIAEKDEYKVVTKTPMPLKEAEELAAKLAESDDDLADKHGPAGAIPVLTDRRTVRVDIPEPKPYTGAYRTKEQAALQALREAGDLKEGEKVGYGIQGSWRTNPRTGGFIHGFMYVPLEGGPLEHRGWLFFGYASY
ncbi:hypothetical protein PV516_19110 [Streptomyces scabiei]|uniref:hypothetical protein n=1 Tax=Streptomyces scabiei TaxID=1930 RepID=UPI0029B80DA5|nr:hypothetical protein [Streptomyces scabiei]MDX3165898.1 hypothetical protein [Streptomyces scabiei]